MKKKRLWRNLTVKKISVLTDGFKPANDQMVLFKAAGNLVSFCKVDKQEEGLLYVTVASVNPDLDGDAPASLLELKKAAHTFAKNGFVGNGCVDKNHDMQDMAGCFVAESWVDEQSGKWLAVVDISGNSEMLQKARSGQISGVSLFGPAEVESVDDEDKESLLEKFFSLFAKKENLNKGEAEMDASAIEKMLNEKYGLKPVSQETKAEDTATTKPDEKTQTALDALTKQVADLSKSLAVLSKGRETAGDGNEVVKMEDLLKSVDKLEDFQKKHPERFAIMQKEYYAKGE